MGGFVHSGDTLPCSEHWYTPWNLSLGLKDHVICQFIEVNVVGLNFEW